MWCIMVCFRFQVETKPCSQFKVEIYILSCFGVVMMINDGADELAEGEAS